MPSTFVIFVVLRFAEKLTENRRTLCSIKIVKGILLSYFAPGEFFLEYMIHGFNYRKTSLIFLTISIGTIPTSHTNLVDNFYFLSSFL